jgi:threo-3-hydroxy-L-aspartate ammonia-lyase
MKLSGSTPDPELVAAASIAEAARGLAGVALRTPLLPAPWAAERTGADILLKCENLQRTGAFKLRGAYTALARMADAGRARGVITYSSGNHAQALAQAAALFGVPAVVVMPTTAPPLKVEGARRLGAEIILEGTTSLERRTRAEAVAAQRGLAMVPPFDHPDIIAGQGTVALEILEDAPDVELVVVPVGGGGLLAGIATWVRHARPACRVVGVEPERACALRRSLDAREPVTIEAAPTLADGLAPVRPGDLTFAHARALVDDVVLVSEDDILAATRALIAESHLVVEFSGAAALAALLARRVDADGARTAVVLSGGNLDFTRAAALLFPS